MSEIKPLGPEDFDAIFAYLNHQLAYNGKDGYPLFMPVSRTESAFPEEKWQNFIADLVKPVAGPRWRRAWFVEDENGQICGHVDLRAHPEPHTRHRALLGLGVLKSHHRRGYGEALMYHVMNWVKSSDIIEIIDLSVLSANVPARKLYEKLGFETLCEIKDMFRIDGNSESHFMMTKVIRQPEVMPENK